ncbi:MAG TPA: hypothetical protein PKA54_02575 [Chitinophagaceae bacterium]|nr:MAG: hypothetical protein UZ11_BCD004000246 [Bacteroidetes bacterium OLB11]MCC7333230.1 hypothetical protein [Flavobacteriales bacterium]HMN32237.1 hypothetical protein [Chitinophagaceae bacterium]
MKRIISIATTLFILIFFACNKKNNQTVTVVRDCTGTYLRLNGRDYQVCNLEKVASFSTGAKVTVTFKILTECNDSSNPAAACEMFHKSKG